VKDERMIQEAIQRLVERKDLSEAEATGAMNAIMTGAATPVQIGAFLTALRMKGETVEEVVGLARVMRNMATAIHTERRPLVDTCGTGGDGSHTFNISTAAAFVVAGGGVAVAKHGNRAASSRCGSADVLSALGVNVAASVEVVERCLDEVGIGFLFAPALHGAMKHAIGPRRELGIRTVFNILGPLTNPAGADCQLLGVFDGAWARPLAEVLGRLGSVRALVVHGADGLDELTTTTTNHVAELRGGDVSTYDLDPAALSMVQGDSTALKGGDADENAAILRAVLCGEEGPRRDIVLLNAAGAFVAAGVARDFRDGLEMARESVDSGSAMGKLDELIRASGGGAS
jgi:anthranilate phosphoribosyltransferase